MDLREARRQPFRDEWRDILRGGVPFYSHFDDETKARFEEQLKVFLLTKEWCASGLVLDDRIRVTISALACRLSLNIPGEEYRRLLTVNVHREHFARGKSTVLGTGGRWSVSLSWTDVLEGIAKPHDGQNVGYHEFAHVLDHADGVDDGIPILWDPALEQRWRHTFAEGLCSLRESIAAKRPSLLRPYAAKDAAEFFAEATECFFEQPRRMRSLMPKIYELLTEYYRQHPALEPLLFKTV